MFAEYPEAHLDLSVAAKNLKANATRGEAASSDELPSRDSIGASLR
jgi:hypothetical protein